MNYSGERHYNIHEAKRDFSKLISRVEEGEEIIIDRRNKPVAKLSATTDVTDERPIGTAEDFVTDVEDGFNDPLPGEQLERFYK